MQILNVDSKRKHKSENHWNMFGVENLSKHNKIYTAKNTHLAWQLYIHMCFYSTIDSLNLKQTNWDDDKQTFDETEWTSDITKT